MTKTSKFILTFLLLTIVTGSINAQVFLKNTDNFPLGTYTRDQLIADWQTKSGNGFSRRGEGEDRVTIVTSTNPDQGNALKVKYPKGKADSKESGAQWETDLKNGYEDLYLSYDIMFSPDFEFVKPGANTGRTGKLPGLAGGLSFDDKDDATTAWDGKLQYRDKDELEFNVKTPLNNSKHFTWLKKTYTIAKGTWFNIEIRYKLNQVGKKDGIMQAWIDGELLGEYTNAEFRDNPNVKINKMFFSTFYGGNVENDAPTKDVFAYFDNFIVDTKRINKKVGNTTATSTVPENPCKDVAPRSLDNKIQAESFCRATGVVTNNDYVTQIDAGDYMEYFVNIPKKDTYRVTYRVASNKNSERGAIRFRLSGNNINDINIPNTQGDVAWKTITHDLELERGNRTIRLTAVNGGGWNFDYFNIEKIDPVLSVLSHNDNKSNKIIIAPNPSKTGVFTLNKDAEWSVFSITGNKIASGKQKQVNLSNQSEGLYILRLNNTFIKIIINY